ncbi:MAG: glycoside hydrolase family 3 C-terminal domain-containing protein [Bacteroidales bacterium]|nr:glycoside hydrolase family 3 C-terminal domain-containing protein [Bacteroidales bacterium]
MHSITALVASLILPIASSCCSKQDKIEKRVDELLSQMTLEEKIGIIHAQSKFSSRGVPRLGIPDLWTDDGPHGVRPETLWDAWSSALQSNDSCTVYPSLTCLAATWDRDLAELYGSSVGAEARYRKKAVLLGPGVNIMRTPLCGRNFEYMGEDPYLSGEIAAPYVRGVQSNGVAACVKHYCLNNQEFKRHNVNVNVDDRTLYEIYLPAFEKAVKEGGAWSIMGSYNLYNEQHCCHNEITINKILKGEWGFDGALISDWGGVHNTDEAIHNGVDLEFGTGTNGVDINTKNNYDKYYLALPYYNKIKSGEVGEDELNEKCRRVLRLMLRTSMDGKYYFGSMNSPEHSADARKIADGGIVLLKNEGGVLPICSESTGKIVVLGENAIKPMAVGGSSSSLKARYEISFLDGIKAAFPNAEVVYERAYQGEPTIEGYNYSHYDITDPRTPEQLLSDAIEAVKDADHVIFIGGLNKAVKMDCEGADRLQYGLPYGQDEIIDTLATLRKDLIFINVSGSPVAMPWIGKVPAVLQAWYLGSETGNAMADVLTGSVNPSGKLPFTFPVRYEDCPIKTEAQYPGIAPENPKGIWEEVYSEGVFVGYRWYEANEIKPLFAFGHGLSYTSFEYGKISLSSKKMHKSITVSVPVTNTGKTAGAEVVQLYVSDRESSVVRPVKELKGFGKVYLEPGEKKVVKMTITPRDLSFFDSASHSWVAEKGEFEILVGAASDDIRCREVIYL